MGEEAAARTARCSHALISLAAITQRENDVGSGNLRDLILDAHHA